MRPWPRPWGNGPLALNFGQALGQGLGSRALATVLSGAALGPRPLSTPPRETALCPGLRPGTLTTALGETPSPQPWSFASGHVQWPFGHSLSAMAKGPGQRPWPRALAQGPGRGHWPRALAKGPWPRALAKGTGQGPWPRALAKGTGQGPWQRARAKGAGQEDWPAKPARLPALAASFACQHCLPVWLVSLACQPWPRPRHKPRPE